MTSEKIQQVLALKDWCVNTYNSMNKFLYLHQNPSMYLDLCIEFFMKTHDFNKSDIDHLKVAISLSFLMFYMLSRRVFFSVSKNINVDLYLQVWEGSIPACGWWQLSQNSNFSWEFKCYPWHHICVHFQVTAVFIHSYENVSQAPLIHIFSNAYHVLWKQS